MRKIEIKQISELSNVDIHNLNEFCDEFKVLSPQYYYEIINILNKMGLSVYYILCYDWNKLTGFLPYTIKETVIGSIINSNPYIGYGGTISKRSDIQVELFQTLIKHAISQNMLALTISTPPIQNDLDYDEIINEIKFDFIKPNFYQFARLDKHPIEILKAKRRAAIKNEIKKAMDANIKVNFHFDSLDFEKWQDIYLNRYFEIGAKPYPKYFFENIEERIFLNGKAILVSAKIKNELIGGILFLIGNGIADYFSSAFKTEYLHLNPTSYLLDESFQHLMKNGIELFNWQSSPNKGGVYQYKKKWGAEEANHYYLTKLLVKPEKLSFLSLETVKKYFEGFYFLPYEYWEK